MRTRVETGFTLVELLIVVVILGILAAIVVLATSALTDQADSAGCKSEADSFSAAIAGFRAQHSNSLPGGSDDTEDEIAAILYGDDLLSKEDTKYGGQPQGWSYDPESGRITNNCPA